MNHLNVCRGIITVLIIITSIGVVTAQSTKAEKEVKVLLAQQAEDWNKGDIEAFMTGYLKSDDLTFIGSRGVTTGWDQTMASYKKGYPTRAAMGHLRFELMQVKQQSKKVVSVVGKFILDRKDETLDGYFLLIVKKVKGKWYIVADHTSSEN